MSQKIAYIPVIDTLRGVAALLVCLFHFVGMMDDYIQNAVLDLIFDYGYYGVHMFFVISGIVIPLSMWNGKYKYASWKNFILKRFIRIEPAYIASIFLSLAYLFVRNYVPSSAEINLLPGWKSFLLHFGYLVPFFEGEHWINPVYWTLAIEFQYYLILCLFFPLVVHPNRNYRYLSYGAFFLMAFLIPNYRFAPSWMPLFLVGISFSIYKANRISKNEFFVVASLGLIATGILAGAAEFAFGLVTILIIVLFPNARNKLSKFLGDISYSLYLVHFIVGRAFINYFSHIFTEPYQKFLVICGGLAISIISAYFMFLLFERPSKGWAARIRY